jgi:hypothetical protein
MMDDAERSYLEKLKSHWYSSADRLMSQPEGTDECLRECDETAAIVLRDCAFSLERFLLGLPPLVGMSPEEKLLQAINESNEPNEQHRES